MNSLLPGQLATEDLDPMRRARLQQRAHRVLSARRRKMTRAARKARLLYDRIFEPLLAGGLCTVVFIWTARNLSSLLGP
ncbi:MAG: hypothetical protein JRF33_27010 [Deltaproteobacteria bacterium]|nr:hypothetical protein [Deltaproteobacteria bacterium]